MKAAKPSCVSPIPCWQLFPSYPSESFSFHTVEECIVVRSDSIKGIHSRLISRVGHLLLFFRAFLLIELVPRSEYPCLMFARASSRKQCSCCHHQVMIAIAVEDLTYITICSERIPQPGSVWRFIPYGRVKLSRANVSSAITMRPISWIPYES